MMREMTRAEINKGKRPVNRFVSYFDKYDNYIIQDLVNEAEYQVGFAHGDEDLFLELLNKISNENEELKKENTKKIVENNGLNCEYQWIKEENERLKELLNGLVDNEK